MGCDNDEEEGEGEGEEGEYMSRGIEGKRNGYGALWIGIVGVGRIHWVWVVYFDDLARLD